VHLTLKIVYRHNGGIGALFFPETAVKLKMLNVEKLSEIRTRSPRDALKIPRDALKIPRDALKIDVM